MILLGLVSLLSDVVYEGGRSILGPYLSLLGAGGLIVGAVAGGGELLGYSFRLLFGYLADRTRAYWLFILTGYALTLLSVPLIGLVNSLGPVVLLVMVERLGKAIRTPSRDAILSFATPRVGYGKAFGIHEFFDQLGAVMGPLVVAGILALSSSYNLTFLSLFLPSSLAMFLLFRLRDSFVKVREKPKDTRKPKDTFYLYLLSSSLLSLGFVQFPLIAFHWKEMGLLSDSLIPFLFSLAMLLDAISALFFGALFDRIGMYALSLGVLTGIPATFLLFTGESLALYIGIALWGVSLGVQESIMRSAVAKLTGKEERGRAYGLFHFFLGISIFVGNSLMGFLYTVGIFYLVTYSVLLQILSVPLLLICEVKSQE